MRSFVVVVLGCMLALAHVAHAGAQPESSSPPPPPPGVGDPQAQQPTPSAGPRFGVFVGGLSVPGENVTAYAGGALVTFRKVRRGFEPRLFALAYRVEDDHTITVGSSLVIQDTWWFGGAYGFGFGSGIGYASFEQKTSSGWDDSSLQILFYVAPVVLRFGAVELGLNAGATRFFAHDVRPFGYAYAALTLCPIAACSQHEDEDAAGAMGSDERAFAVGRDAARLPRAAGDERGTTAVEPQPADRAEPGLLVIGGDEDGVIAARADRVRRIDVARELDAKHRAAGHQIDAKHRALASIRDHE